MPVRRLDAGMIGLNSLNYISSSLNGYVLTYGTVTVRSRLR